MGQLAPKEGRRGKGRKYSAAKWVLHLKVPKSRVFSWAFVYDVPSIRGTLLQRHPAHSFSDLGLSLYSGASSRKPSLVCPPSSWTGAGDFLGFSQYSESSITALSTLSCNDLGVSVSPTRLFADDYIGLCSPIYTVK